MTYKTLLTVLLITTTSYSQGTRQAKKALPLLLFKKTYSKVTRTVQRLIKYFHQYVWASWSKTSLLLLILCACITAKGMTKPARTFMHMVQKKSKPSLKKKSQPPPAATRARHQDLNGDTSAQPTPQARTSAQETSSLWDTQATTVPIDSPRSAASDEREIPHSKVMAQIALGAAAVFASGCALKALRTRHQSQEAQPAPAAQEAESNSEEPVYGPLYPTDIPLINSLPQEVQQLLISYLKGPFKLFHEQRRSLQNAKVKTCFHRSLEEEDAFDHIEESLAFINNEHIKFLTYTEKDFPTMHQPKPTTTCCSCVKIYIGPPKEGLISKAITPCESQLPSGFSHFDERFPKPVCAPEEHRVSIYKPSSHKKYVKSSSPSNKHHHYLYESTIGDVSRFGDGTRRVLPDKPALWFVPFKTFLAIYEEITPRTPRHHIIDEDNYPHPPEIPLIIHSRCKKPHQLIQLIKAPHDIEALTVPLAQGNTYQKRPTTVLEHDCSYDRRRPIPGDQIIPTLPSTASSIDVFAFNFDRNTQGSVDSFGFIGSLELTGHEIKKERYIAYPLHTGPDRKRVTVYAQREDVECVIFKRRDHPTDYDVAELFQQVVPPPLAPEPTRFKKMRNLLMPPQKEKLEIRF